MQYVFLFGRLLFGGYFALNGFRNLTRTAVLAPVAASKGVPAAPLAIVVSGLMIAAGGLAIVAGCWVRPGAALIVLFLVVVTPVMHNFRNDPDRQRARYNKTQFEKNIALLGAAIMLCMIPEPWAISLAQ